jgi:hypothetical protein
VVSLDVLHSNRDFRRKPLAPLYKILFPPETYTIIVKTCIKIIDVLSYSDLRAMRNTSGIKQLTLYALGYRMIQLFNAFLQYFGQIDLLSNH